jgi:hypothetical protein
MDSSVSFTGCMAPPSRSTSGQSNVGRRMRNVAAALQNDIQILSAPTSGLCDILRIRPFDPEKFVQRCHTHPQDAIYKCGNMKWTPLHRLVSIGSSAFEAEIEEVPRKAAVSKEKDPPPTCKSRTYLLSLVRFVLKISGNKAASAVDVWNRTPLYYAVEWNAPLSVILEILEAYPEACIKRDQNGITPLLRQWDKYCGKQNWEKGESRSTMSRDAFALVNHTCSSTNKASSGEQGFSEKEIPVLELRVQQLQNERKTQFWRQFHGVNNCWNKLTCMILSTATIKDLLKSNDATPRDALCQDTSQFAKVGESVCLCPFCCPPETSINIIRHAFHLYGKEDCPLEISAIMLVYSSLPFPPPRVLEVNREARGGVTKNGPRHPGAIPLLPTFLQGLSERRQSNRKDSLEERDNNSLMITPTWSSTESGAEATLPPIIKLILSRLPHLASERDVHGNLPLHASLAYPTLLWQEEIEEVVNAFPHAVSVIDTAVLLPPFALAALCHKNDVLTRIVESTRPKPRAIRHAKPPLQMEGGAPADIMLLMSSLEGHEDKKGHPTDTPQRSSVHDVVEDLERLTISYQLLLFDPSRIGFKADIGI